MPPVDRTRRDARSCTRTRGGKQFTPGPGISVHREEPNSMSQNHPTRRDFVRSTAALTAAAAFASLGTNFAHAAGSDVIRVGLVGCGGRGTGAATDCINGGDNVHLVALADMFPDRIDSAKERL